MLVQNITLKSPQQKHKTKAGWKPASLHAPEASCTPANPCAKMCQAQRECIECTCDKNKADVKCPSPGLRRGVVWRGFFVIFCFQFRIVSETAKYEPFGSRHLFFELVSGCKPQTRPMSAACWSCLMKVRAHPLITEKMPSYYIHNLIVCSKYQCLRLCRQL